MCGAASRASAGPSVVLLALSRCVRAVLEVLALFLTMRVGAHSALFPCPVRASMQFDRSLHPLEAYCAGCTALRMWALETLGWKFQCLRKGWSCFSGAWRDSKWCGSLKMTCCSCWVALLLDSLI